MLEEAAIKDMASSERIDALSGTIASLRGDFDALKTQQEETDAALVQERSLKAVLAMEKMTLEQEMKKQEEKFAVDLRKAQESTPEQDALRRELDLQRREFQKRLNEINEILGMNLEATIHTWAAKTIEFSLVPQLKTARAVLQF